MINPPTFGAVETARCFLLLVVNDGSSSTENPAMGSVCFSCLLAVVLCLSVLPLLLQTVTLAGLMSQHDLTLCREFHTRWLDWEVPAQCEYRVLLDPAPDPALFPETRL